MTIGRARIVPERKLPNELALCAQLQPVIERAKLGELLNEDDIMALSSVYKALLSAGLKQAESVGPAPVEQWPQSTNRVMRPASD